MKFSFFSEKPLLLYTCAIFPELPSYISTMVMIMENKADGMSKYDKMGPYRYQIDSFKII